MPHLQAIVNVAAVCGVAFLALGLFRVWGVAAARSRRPRGRLRLSSRRDGRRQLIFAAVYLGVGVYLLSGVRPRVAWIRPPASAAPAAGLEAEVGRLVAARPEQGAWVVGIVRGEERRLLTLGSLALAGGEPPDAGTIFPIGSITKTFTGVLLAEMAARGEVALGDPVRRHLPPGTLRPSPAGREITLLDLATHASGLPRMPPYMGPTPTKLLTWRLLRDRYRGHTRDELFERLPEVPLAGPPGETFAYSNLGTGLLGHALERAAGLGYEELVRRRIAAPLDMATTRVTLTPELEPRLAPGLFDAWSLGPLGVELPAPRWETRVLEGSGALVSSGEDLLRYLEANLRPPPTPLGDAIRASHRRRRDGDGDGDVGLGWQLAPWPGKEGDLVWHSGATSGYTSFLGFLPDAGAGVFVLHNTARPVDALARRILEILLAEGRGHGAFERLAVVTPASKLGGVV